MTKLTRNEIITLMHLSDGNEHKDIPEGLTPAQYYTALRKLKEQDMVLAAFVEGGAAEAAKLQMVGKAFVDDIQVDRKRILRKILKEKGLTPDQYELLSLAARERVDYNNNIVQENSDTDLSYIKLVFQPLEQKDLLYIDSGTKYLTEIVISRLGKQLLEEIEDELYSQLDYNEGYTIQSMNQGDDMSERENQGNRKIAQVKIANRKKNSVVFALMALYHNNAFKTNLGRDETIGIILQNAFGIDGKKYVGQTLSPIFNRAKKKTPEVFIDELVAGFKEELKDALAIEMSKKNEK